MMRHLRRSWWRADGWLASGTACQTAQRNVFVAGDFALWRTTLIQAIGHAKECARKVDAWLTGRPRTEQVAQLGAAFRSKLPGGRTTGRTAEMNVIPIHSDAYACGCGQGAGGGSRDGFAEPVAKEERRAATLPLQVRDRGPDCVLCDECLKVKPVGRLHRRDRFAAAGRRGTDFELYQSGKGRDRLTLLQPPVDRPEPMYSLRPVARRYARSTPLTIQKVTLAATPA